MPQIVREPAPPPGITRGKPGPAELAFTKKFWLFLLLLPAMVAAALVIAAFILRRAHVTQMSAPVAIIMFAPAFGAFFAWAAIIGLARRRARQRDLAALAEKGFRICLKCRYPLPSEADQGRCPECGTAFKSASLADSWRWTYSKAAEKADRRGLA